jgi:hypothetical protein
MTIRKTVNDIRSWIGMSVVGTTLRCSMADLLADQGEQGPTGTAAMKFISRIQQKIVSASAR